MLTYINTNGESIRHGGEAKIIIGNASPGTRSKELGAMLSEVIVKVK